MFLICLKLHFFITHSYYVWFQWGLVFWRALAVLHAAKSIMWPCAIWKIKYIYINNIVLWRCSPVVCIIEPRPVCHVSFLPSFILFAMMNILTLFLIMFNNLRKKNDLSSDLWSFIYHFVIIITEFIKSRSSLIGFSMPNNISHSSRFNFKSISLYSQFSTLSHIALLFGYWYRWCSSVSISWQ